MCLYMYIYTFIYIYTYMYTHTHTHRYEHHPQLCTYATFMLSGFALDVADLSKEIAAADANRSAIVLNCRLFRRGEGWVTRQER